MEKKHHGKNYMDLRQLRRFHSGAAVTLPDNVASISTHIPHSEATLEKNVWVTFFQALIPAFALSLLFLVAYSFSLDFWVSPLTAKQVFLLWLAIFLVSFLAVWAIGIGLSNELLWKIEEITGRDFTNDNQIGRPTTELWVRRGTGQKLVKIAADSTQFMAWKNAVLRQPSGREDLTYRTWVRKEEVFTEGEYADFLNSLAVAGIVNIGENTRTAKLTSSGRKDIAR